MVSSPIDWQLLLQLTNGKQDIAHELLGMFADELPALAYQIKQSYESKQWETMQQVVHKLHGSCCYTGVPTLKNFAMQVEELLKFKRYKLLDQPLNDLFTEIDHVLNAVKDSYHEQL